MQVVGWQERDLEANGLKLHVYQKQRPGAAKIFLSHGFSDNGLCWLRTANHLADRFDVTLVDARNHGLSSEGEAKAGAMVEDLAALVRTLSPSEPVYLLGHSMGAATTAGVAAKYPDLVKAAILEDPPWIEENPNKSDEERAADEAKRTAQFQKFFASLKTQTETELLKFARGMYPDWHEDDLPDWAQSKLQLGEAAARGLNFDGWREDASAITVPTLLVYTDGQRDGLLKASVVAAFTRSNKALTGAEIKGAGHNIRRENFPDFIAAVDQFLGG